MIALLGRAFRVSAINAAPYCGQECAIRGTERLQASNEAAELGQWLLAILRELEFFEDSQLRLQFQGAKATHQARERTNFNGDGERIHLNIVIDETEERYTQKPTPNDPRGYAANPLQGFPMGGELIVRGGRKSELWHVGASGDTV